MDSNLEYVMMCSMISSLRKALREIENTKWRLPSSHSRIASDAIKHTQNIESRYRALDEAQTRKKYIEDVVRQSKIADGTIPRSTEQGPEEF